MLAHLVVEEMEFHSPSAKRNSQGNKACIRPLLQGDIWVLDDIYRLCSSKA